MPQKKYVEKFLLQISQAWHDNYLMNQNICVFIFHGFAASVFLRVLRHKKAALTERINKKKLIHH